MSHGWEGGGRSNEESRKADSSQTDRHIKWQLLAPCIRALHVLHKTLRQKLIKMPQFSMKSHDYYYHDHYSLHTERQLPPCIRFFCRFFREMLFTTFGTIPNFQEFFRYSGISGYFPLKPLFSL